MAFSIRQLVQFLTITLPTAAMAGYCDYSTLELINNSPVPLQVLFNNATNDFQINGLPNNTLFPNTKATLTLKPGTYPDTSIQESGGFIYFTYVPQDIAANSYLVVNNADLTNVAIDTPNQSNTIKLFFSFMPLLDAYNKKGYCVSNILQNGIINPFPLNGAVVFSYEAGIPASAVIKFRN